MDLGSTSCILGEPWGPEGKRLVYSPCTGHSPQPGQPPAFPDSPASPAPQPPHLPSLPTSPVPQPPQPPTCPVSPDSPALWSLRSSRASSLSQLLAGGPGFLVAPRAVRCLCTSCKVRPVPPSLALCGCPLPCSSSPSAEQPSHCTPCLFEAYLQLWGSKGWTWLRARVRPGRTLRPQMAPYFREDEWDSERRGN